MIPFRDMLSKRESDFFLQRHGKFINEVEKTSSLNFYLSWPQLYLNIPNIGSLCVRSQEMPNCCGIELVHGWSMFSHGLKIIVPMLSLVSDYLLHRARSMNYTKVQTNLTPNQGQGGIYKYWTETYAHQEFNFKSIRTKNDIAIIVADTKFIWELPKND